MMASKAAEDFVHIAGIFELLFIERADARLAEQLDEADDIGQRRAQFIRDMMHEIIAQTLGVDQRLIAFGQRALYIDARR